MSYLRESERYGSSGLPTISRAGIVETSGRRNLTTLDSSHYGHRDQVFYPRPTSPVHSYERKYANEIDELYARDRIAQSAQDKSEIAALQVKVDGLQAQIRELQVQLDIREQKIRELKIQVETSRESEAKHSTIAAHVRAKLVEYEAHSGEVEGAASRSEVAIAALQRQTREQQDKILHLESRIRQLSEEREGSEVERVRFEQRYTELYTRISSILGCDATHVSIETITVRLSDLTQENSMLRGKLNSMKEYLANAELETKASRETIMRLVSEAEREQRVATKYTMELDNVKMDHEIRVARERELVREIEVLKERLESAQRAWNSTRQELEERETRFSRNEAFVRESETVVRTVEQTFRAFKEQMAGLLSDANTVVEPYEEQIRERTKHLMHAGKDKSAHIDLLEQKVATLTSQLEKQYDVHKSADHRLRQSEVGFIELQDRLKRAEAEIASLSLLRDGMRADKERYLRFLEDLSVALNMEAINLDMGLEHATLSLMARVEQLVGKEGDLLQDRKTHIYNLQRKIKSLKEQLDSKELHMDLLRKKLSSMEERLVGRTDVEREKDEEFVKNRKLLKLCEKYKAELNERRMEIQELKAKLLESSEIRNRTMEQERVIEELESKVGQLEGLRSRQAEKISTVQADLNEQCARLGEKRDMAHKTVHTLTSELKSVKLALQEVTNRERQLLDLRQVLARMLGLDVNSLAVPDYEIISRLEKLILANQSNVATVVALDSALEGVSDGFRSGYEIAARTMATRARSPVRVLRTAQPGRTRSRSMSPSRKRDTRAY